MGNTWREDGLHTCGGWDTGVHHGGGCGGGAAAAHVVFSEMEAGPLLCSFEDPEPFLTLLSQDPGAAVS